MCIIDIHYIYSHLSLANKYFAIPTSDCELSSSLFYATTSSSWTITWPNVSQFRTSNYVNLRILFCSELSINGYWGYVRSGHISFPLFSWLCFKYNCIYWADRSHFHSDGWVAQKTRAISMVNTTDRQTSKYYLKFTIALPQIVVSFQIIPRKKSQRKKEKEKKKQQFKLPRKQILQELHLLSMERKKYVYAPIQNDDFVRVMVGGKEESRRKMGSWILRRKKVAVFCGYVVRVLDFPGKLN